MNWMNKHMTLILYFEAELKVISTSIFYHKYCWGYLIGVHVLRRFSRIRLFGPHGLQPARLLCPWGLQARTLEWVAMRSSRGSSWPRDQTHFSYVSCTGRWVLYHWCHLGSPLLNILMVKCFLINFLGDCILNSVSLIQLFLLVKNK